MLDDLLTRLRAADEDTVQAALADAYVAPPLASPAELLEFFNRMLDVVAGEKES